ncbi:hypothetical protein D3C79_1003290 [compost metagenome]
MNANSREISGIIIVLLTSGYYFIQRPLRFLKKALQTLCIVACSDQAFLAQDDQLQRILYQIHACGLYDGCIHGFGNRLVI